MNTIPGPLGRPCESVTPEVSECSRMPRRRRRASTAAVACPPSCAIVITVRASGHTRRLRTTTSAAAAVARTTSIGGSGWVSATRDRASVSEDGEIDTARP